MINTDKTSGGSDGETDEQFRERIPLSNTGPAAGSDDKYKLLAKSTSPLILDVAIDNGGGGVVNIYPLVAGDETSTELLDAVKAVCRPKDARPTSDLVNAYSPTRLEYAIDYSLVLYGSVADPSALLAASKAAVQAVADANASMLGVDTIISQLIAAGSLPGVYKMVVNSPAADVVVSNTEVSVCTGITAVVSGFNYDK
jgi:phage-related baseplate assembly protein